MNNNNNECQGCSHRPSPLQNILVIKWGAERRYRVLDTRGLCPIVTNKQSYVIALNQRETKKAFYFGYVHIGVSRTTSTRVLSPISLRGFIQCLHFIFLKYKIQEFTSLFSPHGRCKKGGGGEKSKYFAGICSAFSHTKKVKNARHKSVRGDLQIQGVYSCRISPCCFLNLFISKKNYNVMIYFGGLVAGTVSAAPP